MKKLSKMLALGLAMALTFGMTVCAAESTGTATSSAESEAQYDKVTGAASESGKVELLVVSKESYDAAEKIVADLVKGDDYESASIIAAADVKLSELTAAEISKGVSVTLNVSAVKEGNNYVALHQKADGSWETLPVEVVADGVVKIKFTSLSPVVLVQVEKADVDDDDDDAEKAVEETPAADGTVASPKTGETLPVAGVMAVICLTGAVVCAKKVRFSE